MSRIVPFLGCLAVGGALLWAAEARPQAQEKRVAALIEKLGDEEFDAREKARRSLEKIGEPAWDALAKAKDKHADPEVRRQARKALAVIFEVRLSRLVSELGDKAKPKRDAAAKELVKLLLARDEKAQQEAAKAALTQAMKKHKDAAVRKGAEDALKQAYADRIKELIEQLSNDSFQTREDAQRELLEIGLPALGPLKEALKSPDLETVHRARMIVRRIEGN